MNTSTGLAGSDDEQRAQGLLEDADGLLEQSRPDLPAGLACLLFGSAAAEDLLSYGADEIAALAEGASTLLAQRSSARASIRLTAPGAPPGRLLADVAVLEILNDDMPFLLDSVLAELGEQGLTPRFVAHPVLAIERDARGGARRVSRPAPNDGHSRESFIHIHLDRAAHAFRRESLIASLAGVLDEVRICVADWQPMLSRLRAMAAQAKASASSRNDELAEAALFLEWLADNNFTFLGLREEHGESGLGLFRNSDSITDAHPIELASERDHKTSAAQEPVLVVTKSGKRSRVHRRAPMDVVLFRPGAAARGTLMLVGLFTSTAYTRPIRSIPYLRTKIEEVIRRAGFDAASHSGKALMNVLEHYPRDDLFQIDADTLLRFSLAMLQLDDRPRVRVLPRADRFGRFASVLVFIPRDRFNSAVRSAIGDHLASAFQGSVAAFTPFFTEGPLVRVHYVIQPLSDPSAVERQGALEQAVRAIVRTWTDDLAAALADAHPHLEAATLLERYRDAFSAGYREAYPASVAATDIAALETLSAARPLAIKFYLQAGEQKPGLKLWSIARSIPLSERVPLLENMGFHVVEERTFHLAVTGSAGGVWFHDMLLDCREPCPALEPALIEQLEACFLAIVEDRAESDAFNALVLIAALPWRDVALLRAIARFLRQAQATYSLDYFSAALRRHPQIARSLVALFYAKFDVRTEASMAARLERTRQIAEEILAALQGVASLDEDVILRRFLSVIEAAVRTDFFQVAADRRPKPTISLKIESRKVDALPAPRPLYEIFVYSPSVEGVHLRFGKVARGGIRWSDRPQDFRTEILGLVKAQQVKNAVIVPVGAKGGFVPRRLVAGMSRQAVQEGGAAAYRLFISSLLDLTDNLGPQGIVPPKDVVRHDAEDPYLVVAADKGTATFSDLANAISAEHGFWLGDAFASGGSAGYDHKAMGITARGAWVAVRRHFREMNVDITRVPFTVAGVGDMSGDVFGNGMLQERTTRLVAAFDHRDIFLDPDPDPEASFAERQRLFGLPTSTWQDYTKSLLSPGGGVFSRGAKEIVLSEQARALLGLSEDKLTPAQVIQAILRMPADLLWFGGIGTFVRASNESDAAAGDRANDAVRVTAAELGCKVIGEGANLAVTQRARIEAAQRAIRLNTDAIDNSAGVNTSDVEVNIKIALGASMRSGTLDMPRRNALLADMTDEVARLVLRNNHLQTLAMSLTTLRGLEDLGFQQRLMHVLEREGALDRTLEALPDDAAILERRRRGLSLTRPEIAVLLAYAKLSLYAELLRSPVPDDPYLGRELARYFPQRLTQEFAEALQQHPLRREIIATQIANSMINRGGPTLIPRITDATGAAAEQIAVAFAAVRDSYDMPVLNAEIDALDGKIDGARQLELYAAIQDLLLDRLIWFLRNADFSAGLGAVVMRHREAIVQLSGMLDDALPDEERAARDARAALFVANGVPDDLAKKIADLGPLQAAPDIVSVADRCGRSVGEAAKTYFAGRSLLGVHRLRELARSVTLTDYFDRLALERSLEQMADAERRLTAEMLGGGAVGQQAAEAWSKRHEKELERLRTMLEEIAATPLTVSKLSIAADVLSDLAGASSLA